MYGGAQQQGLVTIEEKLRGAGGKKH